MEKVQVSELASKLASGAASACRTSVYRAEPNPGKTSSYLPPTWAAPAMDLEKLSRVWVFASVMHAASCDRRMHLNPG